LFYFTLTYHTYNVSPKKDATEKELEGFEKTYQNPIRLRVFNVLKRWVTVHFYDFEEDQTLMASLMDFITNTMIKGSNVTMQKAGEQLKSLIDKKVEGKVSEINIQFSVNPPAPILPTMMPSVLNLSVLDSVEIARQLTLIEYNLYKNIKPQECLGQEWTKKGTRDERAPNIMAMIQRFNAVGHWVTTEILKVEGLKERAQLLGRFIELAAACEKLNNYNAVMEIISGLQASSVYRLKHTWPLVNKSLTKKYQELQTLMSREQNFQKFREHLHSVDPPCIPYLGVYLTDLTFIEDGNKDFIAENLINFDKRRKISQVILEIQQYQQTPYCLEEVPVIKQFLLDVQFWDENEAYAASLKLEPKNMQAPSSTWKSRFSKFKDNPKKGNQTPDQQSSQPGSPAEEVEEEDWGELDLPPNYPFMLPDSKENIILDTDVSALVVGVQPTIKGATLEKLVEKLTSEKYCDPSQVETFLLTYHTFTTNEELIRLLKLRFQVPKPKNAEQAQLERWNSTKTLPIRLRVFNMAKNWIEKYFQGQLANETFIKEYNELADLMIQDGMEKAGNTLKTSMQRLVESGSNEPERRRRPTVAIGQAPKPIIPGNLNASLLLTDINPEEVARQLSLIEQQHFIAVKFWHLSDKNLLTQPQPPAQPAGDGTPSASPPSPSTQPTEESENPFLAIKRQSLYVMNLVGTCIVKQATVELAAATLTHWIKIAEKCLSLNNFNSLAEIVLALDRPQIQRLKLVWHAAPNSVRTSYNKLRDLLDEKNGFAKLRDRLHRSQPPCIPYFGAFYRFLENLNKQHTDKLDNNLINFEKQTLLAGEIGVINQNHQTLYCLEKVEFIQDWLMNQKVFGTEEELAECSHHLQFKKTISKMKSKTGSKDKKRSAAADLLSVVSPEEVGLASATPQSPKTDSKSSPKPATRTTPQLLRRFSTAPDDGLKGQIYHLFQEDEEFRQRMTQDMFMPQIEKALEAQKTQLTEEFNKVLQDFKQVLAQGLIEFCKELEKSFQTPSSSDSSSSPSQLLSASSLLAGLLSQTPVLTTTSKEAASSKNINRSYSVACLAPAAKQPAHRPASNSTPAAPASSPATNSNRLSLKTPSSPLANATKASSSTTTNTKSPPTKRLSGPIASPPSESSTSTTEAAEVRPPASGVLSASSGTVKTLVAAAEKSAESTASSAAASRITGSYGSVKTLVAAVDAQAFSSSASAVMTRPAEATPVTSTATASAPPTTSQGTAAATASPSATAKATEATTDSSSATSQATETTTSPSTAAKATEGTTDSPSVSSQAAEATSKATEGTTDSPSVTSQATDATEATTSSSTTSKTTEGSTDSPSVTSQAIPATTASPSPTSVTSPIPTAKFGAPKLMTGGSKVESSLADAPSTTPPLSPKDTPLKTPVSLAAPLPPLSLRLGSPPPLAAAPARSSPSLPPLKVPTKPATSATPPPATSPTATPPTATPAADTNNQAPTTTSIAARSFNPQRSSTNKMKLEEFGI
jgi:hypothetical protein